MSSSELTIESPTPVLHGVVEPAWIDANAHMNVAYYGLVFDQAVDALWAAIGHDDAYRKAQRSTTFAVEAHTRFLAEIAEGEAFAVTARIIAVDNKRVHQWQELTATRDNRVAATCEWMHLHVDLDTRRVAPWPAEIRQALSELYSRDQGRPAPEGLSRSVSMQRS